MKNSEQPANPSFIIDYNESQMQMRTVFQGEHLGLTKREYFAAKAMQGLLANTHVGGNGNRECDVAKWAVSHADALLAELEKPTTTNQ